jgi:hypothetical protein
MGLSGVAGLSERGGVMGLSGVAGLSHAGSKRSSFAVSLSDSESESVGSPCSGSQYEVVFDRIPPLPPRQ